MQFHKSDRWKKKLNRHALWCNREVNQWKHCEPRAKKYVLGLNIITHYRLNELLQYNLFWKHIVIIEIVRRLVVWACLWSMWNYCDPFDHFQWRQMQGRWKNRCENFTLLLSHLRAFSHSVVSHDRTCLWGLVGHKVMPLFEDCWCLFQTEYIYVNLSHCWGQSFCTQGFALILSTCHI